MICKNCRNTISDGANFCNVCGCRVEEQQVSVAADKAGKTGKTGKLPVIMTIVSVVLCVLLVLSLLDIIPSIKNTADDTVEGPGYDTADAALEAYIAALNQGDIDGMIATFAIESYVDNFDTKAHIERLKSFSPLNPFYSVYELADGSEFDRDIRIKEREASIMYYYSKMLSQRIVQHDDRIISLQDDDEIDAFMKEIEKSEFFDDWKNMEFVKMVDPEAVCGTYGTEQFKTSIMRQAKPYGCNDIRDVCALVKIGKEKYYQTAMCGEYNGRWYIITCMGNLSSLIGLPADSWGLVPCSEID